MTVLNLITRNTLKMEKCLILTKGTVEGNRENKGVIVESPSLFDSRWHFNSKNCGGIGEIRKHPGTLGNV